MRDRYEIRYRAGIEHLPAETLGRDAGTDALACGIDRRRRARRAAADDENVERFLIGEFRRRLGLGAGIDPGEDLFEFLAALRERCAVQEHLRDGHDLARSEEHTSELQSLMRISSAVFCLKKNN